MECKASYYLIWGLGVIMWWVQVKVLFEGLSETYLFCYNLFLQLCTEKEIKDIKIVILCYLFEKQLSLYIIACGTLWS